MKCKGTKRESGSDDVYLFGDNMLLLLFLSLCLQLLFHVLDVPSKAVAVEVVIAGCFGKGLLFL